MYHAKYDTPLGPSPVRNLVPSGCSAKHGLYVGLLGVRLYYTSLVGHLLPPFGGKEGKAIGLANVLFEVHLLVLMTSFVDVVL